MSKMHMIKVVRALVLVILCYICCNYQVEGGEGLSYGYYYKVCPQVEGIVRDGVQSMSLTDPTTPAALLRLMFHDCQVQGCDASILVDRVDSEMSSSRNMGIRKREAINLIKSLVDTQCGEQVVSCADILILAAREAVFISGGPRIDVPLGRRDSFNPTNSSLADMSLPPSNLGVDDMLTLFQQKGLSLEESVAINGAHTLGVTHCFNIESRLYDDPKSEVNEDGFEMYLKLRCPQGSLTSNISFVLNEPTTLTFDNHYFINAINGRGVLRIDAQLPFHPRTAPFVQRFAAHQDAFFQAFSSAFLKLSTSGILTGSQGTIRRSCNALN